MAVVELLLPALASHVRTARLVGVAAARRTGLADELVDELRLAVGEACARAVSLHARYRPEAPVRITVEDGISGLVVTVVDSGPAAAPAPAAQEAFDGEPVEGDVDPDVALAVVTALVDEVDVTTDDSGTTITLRWPLAARRTASTSIAAQAAQPQPSLP